jgi:hypothetical protein
MGLLKGFKGRQTTAAKAQNSPRRIKTGPGSAALDSQIEASPSPFQSPLGVANFQRFRTNGAATSGVGDGKSRNTANIRGGDPMSNSAVVRGAGYSRKPGLAGYVVHDVTQHQFDGAPTTRGNRIATQLTKAKAGGPKPLYRRETNEELFGQGYRDYKKLHGSI